MPKSNITNIAELLPQNMSEEAVNKIATLVQETITEEVGKKLNLLESKVKGFLRTQIDLIKEHALKELTEESELYRNAHLFEEIKALMSIEVNATDEKNAVTQVVKEGQEVEQENELLVEELNRALTENKDLKRSLKVLKGKINQVVTESSKLTEEVKSLTESSKLDFKSSEKAVIIADNMDDHNKTPKKETPQNPFLTEETMALMPKKK